MTVQDMNHNQIKRMSFLEQYIFLVGIAKIDGTYNQVQLYELIMFEPILAADIFEYNYAPYEELSPPLTDEVLKFYDINNGKPLPSDVGTENECYTLYSTTNTVGFDISYKADILISYVMVIPRLSQLDATLSADAFSSNIEVSVTNLADETTVCGTIVDPTIEPILKCELYGYKVTFTRDCSPAATCTLGLCYLGVLTGSTYSARSWMSEEHIHPDFYNNDVEICDTGSVDISLDLY